MACSPNSEYRKGSESDNELPFNSREFADYARYMGFQHKTITPAYPQANGMVERFNSMLKKVIITAKIENKSWQRELSTFLRNYRGTPHSTTGQAPAALFYNQRNFCTRIPEIRVNKTNDSFLRKRDKENKERIK